MKTALRLFTGRWIILLIVLLIEIREESGEQVAADGGFECNLTCTGCGRIREYSTSLKDMVPLEQCLAGGGGMRCADGFHLRRRTADLSEDRGTGERPARTGPRHLHLHERHVHAEENEGLPRGDLFAGSRAEAEKAARPRN